MFLVDCDHDISLPAGLVTSGHYGPQRQACERLENLFLQECLQAFFIYGEADHHRRSHRERESIRLKGRHPGSF